MTDTPETTRLLQPPTPEPVLPAVVPPGPVPTKKPFWLFGVLAFVAIAAGGGTLFARARLAAPSPTPGPEVIPSPTPSPSPSPLPSLFPSPKIVSSPKASSTPKASLNPLAQYPYVMTSDYKDIPVTGWNALGTSGKDGPFSAWAKLTDQAGNVVNDQTSLRYQWVNGNESILTMHLKGECRDGVQSPCPVNYVTFVGNGTNTGSTTATVTAYKGAEQVSNTYTFNVTVGAAKNPTTAPPGL